MTFDGRFKDSLVVDQLDKISLSFLVEDLKIHRGGTAANIAYGMGCLGLHPILVGAVGEDFNTDYRSWLERHNVDCDSIRVSEVRHTARFISTSDRTQAQIGTFYTGAMVEGRDIELEPVAARVGGLDLVLIGPHDPEGMARHTAECKQRGIPFAADPSQQLAFADGDMIRELVAGAEYLLTNEYEAALTEQKTGWSDEEILAQVAVRVTTLAEKGVRIDRRGEPPIHVAAVPADRIANPTGVGDGFRAGFLAGVAWGLSLERSAQVGCVLAVYVLEITGTQEYELSTSGFLTRFAAAYGDEAAAEVAPHVRAFRP
jgi:adenosine kinase